MSPSGAAERAEPPASRQSPQDAAPSSFLPNFCDPRMVLGVVLIAELVALTFALVRPAAIGFLPDLARLSVLMQWLGLTSAALLCALRRPLHRLSTRRATGAVFAVVLANVLILSFAIVAIGHWLGSGETPPFFPLDVLPFAARNLLIGLIVTALLLRYFFVSHQWRRHVESEARSRIDALQARIRPHFLFNSMNTIASLTRSDPARAEAAVEDLADLFRATTSEGSRLVRLDEEFELSRIYQRIEQLRLGERLSVVWDVARLPAEARLPALTIQPLLENAIHHGIEPLAAGGTVTIRGTQRGDEIEIAVSNPTPGAAVDEEHRGNRMAVDNIRERLRLAFAGRGRLEVDRREGQYCARVLFPVRP